MSSLQLEPDRALPFPAEQRSIAREIYAEVKDLPLICMHGHVEPEVLADDSPFADPAQLLIVPDHYVFRMLASQGIEPARLGVPRIDGGPVETDSRTIWRTFCENWKLSAGRPRAIGWNMSWSRYSASIWSRAPKRRTRSTTRSPPASPTLASVRGHCSTASTSRSSPRPTRQRPSCSTTRSSPRTVWASASFPPSGPTPWSTSIDRPGATTSLSWRRSQASTPRPTTVSSTHCVRAAQPSSRQAPAPPITATCWPTPPRWK